MFKCIDTDKDGKIGFEEFLTAATDRQKLITRENNLKQAFDILDKNKNGKLELKEFQEAFSDKVEQQTWDDLNILFKQINKKKDGCIDFNEFRDHMMELIKKGRYERRNNAYNNEFANGPEDKTLPEFAV